MPATEQTWRDSKLLHVVFGISSLAMLLTTIWVLAADHNREFKRWKRKFRDVETWTIQSRINAQDSDEFESALGKLERAVAKTQRAPLHPELLTQFLSLAKPKATENKYKLEPIESARAALKGGKGSSQGDGAAERRAGVVSAMQQVIKRAKFVEDSQLALLKFRKADLSAKLGDQGIAVDNDDVDLQVKIQAEIDAIQKDVQQLTLETQEAKTHRLALQKVLAALTADETEALAALAKQQTLLKQLEVTLYERSANWQKSLLEWPILDAFGGPLKPDQIWLPQLTVYNNFRDVARFDRCTTCHQGIDKTAPGSAITAGYAPVQTITLTLETPAEEPKRRKANAQESNLSAEEALLSRVYGFTLSEEGLFDPTDVTVNVVRPRSLGANAFLMPGDVIDLISDVPIVDKDLAYRYLLNSASVTWGKPITLVVRRGVPHPFSSHPRLDLYVGSLSPHKMEEMGCTICHEGQGSGTDFKWASHTPNNPEQMSEWKRDHGWFNNHHWITPQLPQRFNQSNCLKCHHDVVELEPTERFPDPPAPKLVEGYHLIRQYGCFGCHEINGFDGPTRRRGPDLRAEPSYFAAAGRLLIDPGLSKRERELALEVIEHPESIETRKLLAELIRADAEVGSSPGDKAESRLSAESHKQATMLGADDATPGSFRKVGPSLRYVAAKLDAAFLYQWVRDPTDFRPSTKMPKFFGLHDHLVPDETTNGLGKTVRQESQGLRDAKRFEPVEIRAVTEYLLSASEEQVRAKDSPFDYLPKPEGVTEEPNAERGATVLQERGCLACHQHEKFPEAKSTQGPNLSRLGSKLTTKEGGRWLYSWVREPHKYHARTAMPNLFLEPILHTEGDLKDKVTDPAADVTLFLLQSVGWKSRGLPDLVDEDLDDLALVYLRATFTQSQAEKYVKQGIPAELRSDLKGDEVELVVPERRGTFDLQQQKLRYIGRRTIGRLGCSACHDIPGFEDAKPIGTALADWGRKEPSKLAFEQVVNYLTHQHSSKHGQHATEEGEYDAEGGEHGAGHDAHLDPRSMGEDEGYFVDAILNHDRIGFLWQKLREPRSYDYKKTENKEYTDRLRMPKFNLTDAQREAIMTFVLGLVSEPPAARYLYKPEPRRAAVVRGQKVLDKYNCSGCHTMQMETWEFDYDPREMKDPPAFKDFAFLQPHFTPEQLQASMAEDRRGLGHALVTGMPDTRFEEDDDGNPLTYFFGLWKSAAINGQTWPAGGQAVDVGANRITSKRPPSGGDFARLLYPVALESGRVANPNLKETEVWGWLPPPLVGEGRKVQTQWLHDFLLDPYSIRPAARLRMPKFHMTSEEASDLVNYFAAKDNVDYPYEFDTRTRTDYLERAERERPKRLDDALAIVTDNSYCVKCHMVGDFTPKAAASGMAPRLDRVYQRLRPDFVRNWVANPARLLPYTGMPVNFPPVKGAAPADGAAPAEGAPPAGPPLHEKLFGESEVALDAVVDLLLNYDAYMKSKTLIAPLVKEPPPTDGAADPNAAGNSGGN